MEKNIDADQVVIGSRMARKLLNILRSGEDDCAQVLDHLVKYNPRFAEFHCLRTTIRRQTGEAWTTRQRRLARRRALLLRDKLPLRLSTSLSHPSKIFVPRYLVPRYAGNGLDMVAQVMNPSTDWLEWQIAFAWTTIARHPGYVSALIQNVLHERLVSCGTHVRCKPSERFIRRERRRFAAFINQHTGASRVTYHTLKAFFLKRVEDLRRGPMYVIVEDRLLEDLRQ